MSQPLGVALLIENKKGQLLLGKRLNSYGAGLFGVPGGRVEPGEAIEAAAIRELLEETGIEAEGLKFLGFVKELQASQDFIHFVFLVTTWSGVPERREPDKCEGWEWYTAEELPKMLPGHLAALKLHQNKLRNLEI